MAIASTACAHQACLGQQPIVGPIDIPAPRSLASPGRRTLMCVQHHRKISPTLIGRQPSKARLDLRHCTVPLSSLRTRAEGKADQEPFVGCSHTQSDSQSANTRQHESADGASAELRFLAQFSNVLESGRPAHHSVLSALRRLFCQGLCQVARNNECACRPRGQGATKCSRQWIRSHFPRCTWNVPPPPRQKACSTKIAISSEASKAKQGKSRPGQATVQGLSDS
ncbi:hypothetical protein B0T11DRAFT_110843 [Plectosphaerella cucumerina]|uniref:Uncharacterized protein n=1 Tax=Plectosphaerella cucumerina TaxID=40658 RepID=A0A8K0TCE8_9PEZI|nr:hypothetical protein B0T11DRAFT_110843 [Plectosphaerella cucumerina]